MYRSASLDRAVVVADNMPRPPSGKVYQLWLQNPAGAMVPAGFLPAGSSSGTTLAGDVTAATGAGITVEPTGGSPAPTSDPMALVPFT